MSLTYSGRMASSVADPKAARITEFELPTEKDKLIPWLEQKLEFGRQRMPELQMKLNLAYVLGHQWIAWDRSVRRFERAKGKPGDPNAPVRITANKMGGIVERAISKLTKASPLPECRPVSDSDDDISAAKVGTRILTHELYRLEWDAWLTAFFFWPTVIGWSYVHVRWEPDAGEQVGMLPSEHGDIEELYEGEVQIEEVPAFELSVDPNGRTMRQAKWCVRTTSMTREAVWEKWDKKPEGAEVGRSLVDEVYSLTDVDYSQGGADDFVKVHQFWMVPCRAAPQGLVVTWCGKTILEEPVDFPYDHKRLPFVPFDLLPGIGTREGRTWVNDLIPLQTDYNDARSREAQLRRTLTPKVFAPTGSINPNLLTSRLEVVSYNPTGDKPVVDVPDSGWMMQHEKSMERADMEMGERAGQQDVSSGRAPSASMPAAAILALQEADDTKLAITVKQMAASIQAVGWQILMLVRQFWTEERTVRAWSDDGMLDAMRFEGADVQSNLDVHVSAESALPRSKSARAQLFMEMWAAGIISDPRVLVRGLDVPGIDFVVETLDIDAKVQHRENGRLLQGEIVQVRPWHNHMVHLAEINKLRNSPEYENAPDEIKAVVDDHAAGHESLVLPQLSVPTPPGTEQQGQNPALGALGLGGGAPEYTDPTTGKPPDPTQVAAGRSPSGLSNSRIGRAAGIGGPNAQQGRVKGIERDQQLRQTGN